MLAAAALRIGVQMAGPVVLARRGAGPLHLAVCRRPGVHLPAGTRTVCGVTAKTRRYKVARPGFSSNVCGRCRAWAQKRDPGRRPLAHTAKSVAWSVLAALTDSELSACTIAALPDSSGGFLSIPVDSLLPARGAGAAFCRRDNPRKRPPRFLLSTLIGMERAWLAAAPDRAEREVLEQRYAELRAS